MDNEVSETDRKSVSNEARTLPLSGSRTAHTKPEVLSMSNKVTPNLLAELNAQRSLNTAFEKAWSAHVGSRNPMIPAIMIASRNFTNYFIRWVGFTASVLMCTVAGMVTQSDPGTYWPVRIFCFAVGIALLTLILIGFFYATYTPGSDSRENLNRFCGALQDFYDRSAAFLSFTLSEFLHLGEKDLEKVADEILVALALEILMKQKDLRERAATSSERREVEGRAEISQLEQSFSKVYDTLRNLGVASGGYKPYYRAAKKIVDKKTA